MDVARVRQALGRVGAFLPSAPGDGVRAEALRAAARRVEAAGYRAAWTNETVGKDALVTAGLMLAATDQLLLGTCIANMWVRPAPTAAAAAALLADAYPGRFVLGLGVGYSSQAEAVERDFGRPLSTARSYLQEVPADQGFPRLLAAMGPRMLELAAELADGALPAGAGPDGTAEARAALGPENLLVVYVDVTGPDARGAVRSHLDAGADHVVAGTALGAPLAPHLDLLERLAPALNEQVPVACRPRVT